MILAASEAYRLYGTFVRDATQALINFTDESNEALHEFDSMEVEGSAALVGANIPDNVHPNQIRLWDVGIVLNYEQEIANRTFATDQAGSVRWMSQNMLNNWRIYVGHIAF